MFFAYNELEQTKKVDTSNFYLILWYVVTTSKQLICLAVLETTVL